MHDTYSPIDRPSYTTDSSGYDAEAILRDPGAASPRTEANHSEPEAQPAAPATASATIPTQAAEVTKPKPTGRFAAMLADSRTVMFIGLLLVIAAGYALIVSISYFRHIGSDQSAVLNADFDPEMIKNAGGVVGAWLSHTLIYRWLGIGAFIVMAYVGICGLGLLKVVRISFWNVTMRCLLSAVAVSVVGGFITANVASQFYWGGMHGHMLNEKLILLSGIWGALALSILMVGMTVILFLPEVKRVLAVTSQGIDAFRTRQAARREERLRREAEEEATRTEAERAAAAERAEAERVAAAERAEAERIEAANVAPAVAYSPTLNTNSDTGTVTYGDPLFAPQTAPSAEEYDDDSEAEYVYHGDAGTDEPGLFADSPEDSLAAEEDGDDVNESLFADTRNAEADAPYGDINTLYDPRAELSMFRFPPVEMLREFDSDNTGVNEAEMEQNKARITKTLNDYHIPIQRITATVGPTVTLYEIVPAEGVRVAKIKRLEDDLALSLAALGVRIIAPIPGKGTIGIEVPRTDPQTVSMRSIIESDVYRNSRMELPMAMGCTVSNDVFMVDLCKMPHLLVAGATGMGKSVGLNAIIASLLYKKHPAELKFVLIDPKMVEFSLYAKLERHYLAKLPDEEDAIITDPSKVIATLNSLCVEMENRYALLKKASLRNIKEYNDRFIHRRLNPEHGHKFLPYIVVVVDEFADLIMVAGKEIETPIARIAQKARAVGIHMIIATQRPSTNVITGLIKANFPGRVAFRVFQMVDSRTILDRPGANQLIGRGDMLFSNNGKIDRVQCAFIDTPEVMDICDHIDAQMGYDHAYELPEYIPDTADSGAGGGNPGFGERDPLFDECARIVVTSNLASTSSLQRRFSIGYNRAGKIMDQMEAAGIVGPSQGGKPRQVLTDPVTLEHILENN